MYLTDISRGRNSCLDFMTSAIISMTCVYCSPSHREGGKESENERVEGGKEGKKERGSEGEKRGDERDVMREGCTLGLQAWQSRGNMALIFRDSSMM